MRFHELQEDEATFDQWWARISHQCGGIIQTYQRFENVFYRGSKNKPDVFKDAPRTDRKPRDSDVFDHEFFDVMLHVSRSSVLRSNHIAVSASPSMAFTYGPVYVIFPCDGFKFLYSENVDDLGSIVHYCLPHFITNFAGKLKLDSLGLDAEYLDGQTWVHAVDQAVRDASLEQRGRFYQDNLKLIQQYWAHLSSSNRFNDQNLGPAMKRGQEVMIAGSNFFAVNLDKHKDNLEQKLGFELKEKTNG